jgi:hypothetical protein
MKNIQVIDGAENCSYDVFSIPDDDFLLLFPNDTDIEFIEDLIARLGGNEVDRILDPAWSRRQDKKK